MTAVTASLSRLAIALLLAATVGCAVPASTTIVVYVTPTPGPVSTETAPALSLAPVEPTAPPSAVTEQVPIRLDGDSDSTSAPFDLAGGDYRVTITVTGPACFWSGHVMAVDAGELDTPTMGLASVTLNADEPGPETVETFEYGIPPGSYFLEVGGAVSDCPWVVEIVPA